MLMTTVIIWEFCSFVIWRYGAA